jgi:HAD superfamily hydrolase (TIGR01509 family)
MHQTLGAIFDLDGTLVDSCRAHERAWRELGESVGIEVTRAFFLEHFGRPNRPILDSLFRRAGRAAPTAGELEEFGAIKEATFRRVIDQDFPPMPGGSALLHSLRKAGWRLAIGSSAPPVNVDFMLGHLGCRALFDAIVTGHCVERGKPHPDVFTEAARRLGLAADRCVVIEDAAPGIEAAIAAGMRSVALCSEGHTVEELSRASLVVHHLDALSPSLLQSLLTP